MFGLQSEFSFWYPAPYYTSKVLSPDKSTRLINELKQIHHKGDTLKLIMRTLQNEDDYWPIRNFLREAFFLNDRLEHSWPVARLDDWRWYFIQTCAFVNQLKRD